MKYHSMINKLLCFTAALIIALSSLSACNDSFSGTSTVDEDILDNSMDNQRPYSYEIKVTIDNSPSDGRFPVYTFSRPVLEGTSEFAAEINQTFAQVESEFYDEMQKEEEAYRSYPQDLSWDSNNPWKHTVQSECVFEDSDVVSFTLNQEWYMGGARNKWLTGYVFDFNLGRQLTISDVLYGDEGQITESLVEEFCVWYESVRGDEPTDGFIVDRVRDQSGWDTNFYLSEEGVYVHYKPYTIDDVRDGINILIPWTRTDLVRQL